MQTCRLLAVLEETRHLSATVSSIGRRAVGTIGDLLRDSGSRVTPCHDRTGQDVMTSAKDDAARETGYSMRANRSRIARECPLLSKQQAESLWTASQSPCDSPEPGQMPIKSRMIPCRQYGLPRLQSVDHPNAGLFIARLEPECRHRHRYRAI